MDRKPGSVIKNQAELTIARRRSGSGMKESKNQREGVNIMMHDELEP
jgi:hypothetical protein